MHNLEVAGSIPAPATIFTDVGISGAGLKPAPLLAYPPEEKSFTYQKKRDIIHSNKLGKLVGLSRFYSHQGGYGSDKNEKLLEGLDA